MQQGGAALMDMMDHDQGGEGGGGDGGAVAASCWSCIGEGTWRLDFIAAENSMGFHAPQEAARILGEAIDYARQAQITALKLIPAAKSGTQGQRTGRVRALGFVEDEFLRATATPSASLEDEEGVGDGLGFFQPFPDDGDAAHSSMWISLGASPTARTSSGVMPRDLARRCRGPWPWRCRGS